MTVFEKFVLLLLAFYLMFIAMNIWFVGALQQNFTGFPWNWRVLLGPSIYLAWVPPDDELEGDNEASNSNSTDDNLSD